MGGDFTLWVTPGTAHILVSMHGYCDTTTGREFRDGLTAQVPRGSERLVVDLSRLEFIDSSGVHVLLDLAAKLTEGGGSLTLVSPRPIVARVLELMGADEMIPVVGSVVDALAFRLPAAAPRRPASGRSARG